MGRVEISGGDIALGRVRGASMETQLDGVRFGGGSAGGSVASSHVKVRVSSDAIPNTVKSSVRQLPVTSVAPDQASRARK
ncbi:hypothetical protein [Streptomyces sp. NPDC046859]|uniref:hypothetical protein n=1 Tax=Streptomyces sp. NPDC046859 TaxID=3155734 RepID=UPI0033E110F9